VALCVFHWNKRVFVQSSADQEVHLELPGRRNGIHQSATGVVDAIYRLMIARVDYELGLFFEVCADASMLSANDDMVMRIPAPLCLQVFYG
jgi:hypothetical protein